MHEISSLPPIIDDPQTLRVLKAICEAYELAIASNDAAVLISSFWESDAAVRFGFGENLWGFSEIADFISGRSASDQRWVLRRANVSTFGTAFGTYAAEYSGADGQGTVRIMQTWVCFAQGWRIAAAHVSRIDS